jgi:protein phosphatase
MRVGVLSDVHANLHALDEALHRLVFFHHVHRIVCLGDVVEKGPAGDAVVRRLHEGCIPVVRGNHEDHAVWHHALVAAHGEPPELSNETVARIAAWPLHRQYCWAGCFVELAHGIPGDNGIYCRGQPFPKALRRYLRGHRPDVLLLGHTHAPMALEFEGTLICNPGSVRKGSARDSHTYGVLHLPARRFEVWSLDGPPDAPKQL